MSLRSTISGRLWNIRQDWQQALIDGLREMMVLLVISICSVLVLQMLGGEITYKSLCVLTAYVFSARERWLDSVCPTERRGRS